MGPCSRCVYYSPSEKGSSIGQCHRYPPNFEGKWPQVLDYQWCGEFSRKEERAHYDLHDAMGRVTGKDPAYFKQYRVDDGGVAM